jgi:hypothetical protein
MAGLFEFDLIPKIISVDKKVRLSGMDRRREKSREEKRDDHSRRSAANDSNEKDSEKRTNIDITV